MSPPTERTGPRTGAGPTTSADVTITQGADSRVRLHWHHVLVRRRRWSAELDELCGSIERDPVDLPDDHWRVWGMHRGVRERELAGHEHSWQVAA